MTEGKYKTLDDLLTIWLFLISMIWIFKINGPAYYVLVQLCDLVLHMSDSVI